MSNKFNRNYKLVVESKELDKNGNRKSYIFEPPLDCDININKDCNISSFSSMSCVVYNINANIRKLLHKDFLSIFNIRRIWFYGGYGNNLSLIFYGIIRECYSELQGNRIATIFDCIQDISEIKTTITKTFNPGTTLYDILINVLPENKNYLSYKIFENAKSKLQAVKIERPLSIKDNLINFLNSYNIPYFLDSETIYIGDKDDYFTSLPALLCSSETGLLKTPRRKGFTIIVDTLFEPNAILNRRIILNSSIMSDYNGEYKIVKIEHNGGFGETNQNKLASRLYLVNNKLLQPNE